MRTSFAHHAPWKEERGPEAQRRTRSHGRRVANVAIQKEAICARKIIANDVPFNAPSQKTLRDVRRATFPHDVLVRTWGEQFIWGAPCLRRSFAPGPMAGVGRRSMHDASK